MPRILSYFLLIFLIFLTHLHIHAVILPPRLHLNNTNPVYICQLWDYPIFMNIIEHIPAVRRWCQGGRRNKESHLEAHFSQPRLSSSETKATQWEPEFDTLLLRPRKYIFFHFVFLLVYNVMSLFIFLLLSQTNVPSFQCLFVFLFFWCVTLSSFLQGSLIWFQGCFCVTATSFSPFLFSSVYSYVSGSDS